MVPDTTQRSSFARTAFLRRSPGVVALCLSLVLAGCGGGSNPAPITSITPITPTTPATPTTPSTPSTPSTTEVTSVPAAVPHSISGSVTGLRGTGLVLQNNAGDDLAVNADGSFSFASKLDAGRAYVVTVKSQPTGPTQVCSVNKSAGTVADADINNVSVVCSTSSFAVGGSVAGLQGTGGLVLQNNSGDDITLNASGRFVFSMPVASSAGYAVTVKTQPTSPAQTCSVSQGTGTVTTAAIDNVAITCAPVAYPVSGTVSGLASGASLSLQNNGADNLTVSGNGFFQFATRVASAGTYAVTVLAQPATQTCTVSNGSGTVGSAAITNVAVYCSTNVITVGGTVTGLQGTGLVLQNNAGNDLTLSANGSFTFSTPIVVNSAYAVTVKTQPGVPAQDCTVANGSGTAGSSNVINVVVTCGIASAKMLFVGNSTAAISPGIQPYSMPGTPGTFSATPLPAKAVAGVNSLAVDEDKKIVYAVSQQSVSSFSFTQSGLSNPTSLFTAPFLLSSIVRDPLGRVLFAAESNSSFVGALPLDANGFVQPPTNGWWGTTGPGNAVMAVDPTGRFLYVANAGNQDIRLYRPDAAGSLTYPAWIGVLATTPSAITIDPSGKFLYSVSNAGGSGYVYPINQTTGVLGAAQLFTATNSDLIAMNPGGTLAFTTSGSQIWVYSRNPVDGSLSPLTVLPDASGTPITSLMVDPDGTRLFALQQVGVEAFNINMPYTFNSLGFVTAPSDPASTLGLSR